MGYCRYIGVFAVVTVLYMGRHVGVVELEQFAKQSAQPTPLLLLLLLLKLQTQLKCTFQSVDCACSPDWE